MDFSRMSEREILALRKSEKVVPSKGKKGKRKKVSRVGKLGIVRLYGEDLEKLRRACFDRDLWKCRECGQIVTWDSPIFSLGRPRGEMAHIRTKRNNGDTLGNVRTLCADCHQKEHNAGGKPVPRKSGRAGSGE